MDTLSTPPELVEPALSGRQLAVVNKIARIATQDLELRPMLQRIVDALRDAFAWEFVAYVSIDSEAGRFLCEALATEFPSEVHIGYSRALGSGVCGHVALSGEPILLDDVTVFPGYFETMPGVRSELCVPVRHRGDVIGLINLESLRPAAFFDQLPLLQIVADQVSGIIAAARLHQELGRRAELLEMMSQISHTALQSDRLDQVLTRIVGFVRERFGLEYCSILLAGDQADELVWITCSGDSVLPWAKDPTWSASRGIVGRAYRTGQTQFAPDVTIDADYVMGNPAVAAELVVPIRYHDRLLGVLNMESATADSFTPDLRTMLAALVGQVAGAIHLATINEQMHGTVKLVAEKSALLEHANERLRQANSKLEKLSALDGLTGIANRRQFDAALRDEWRRAIRRAHPVAVLLIDIDYFKAYNDGYGHLAGDDCLRRVASALERSLNRAGDLVARFGGEEFGVLLPETSADEAEKCAELLRRSVLDLGVPHRFAGTVGEVSISVGIASVVPHPGLHPDHAIEMADRAMYAAKLGGRNTVRRYQPPGS